jgi:hypothetical protein
MSATVLPSGRLIVWVGKFVKGDPSTGISQGYIYSDDQGATWSSYTTISNGTMTNYSPHNRTVSIGSGQLMQGWWGTDGTHYNDYVVFSSDAGTTWSSSVTVMSSMGTQYDETAYDYLGSNNILALSRVNNDSFFHQLLSTDNGQHWTDQGRPGFDTWTLTDGSVGSPAWLENLDSTTILAFYVNRNTKVMKAATGTIASLESVTSGWNAGSIVNLGSGKDTLSGYASAVQIGTGNPWLGMYSNEISSTQSNLTFFNCSSALASCNSGGIYVVHFDAYFADGVCNRSVTPANAAISATAKFGGGSASFNGSSTFINFPQSSDFDFGSGSFTVDYWVQFNSLPTSGNLVDMIAQGQDANNVGI